MWITKISASAYNKVRKVEEPRSSLRFLDKQRGYHYTGSLFDLLFTSLYSYFVMCRPVIASVDLLSYFCVQADAEQIRRHSRQSLLLEATVYIFYWKQKNVSHTHPIKYSSKKMKSGSHLLETHTRRDKSSAVA